MMQRIERAMMISDAIEPIRAASRQLVRELGFMQHHLAGTDLPPSAVHAVIEIDAQGPAGMTAGQLAERLRLDKSSVSRMLRKLILTGLVCERPDDADGRVKLLSLSAAGQAMVAAIHHFARTQVAAALARLGPAQRRTVQDGLALYAGALAGCSAPSTVEIVTGYCPGLIGDITALHADYYHHTAGFGRAFEAVVARGLADFCPRLDRPGNQIWSAVVAGRVVGSIAIDGEDLGGELAHLRWFIVAPDYHGQGLGRRLLSAALAFVDQAGFAATHLWTFAGLDQARRLYQSGGFVLAEQQPGDQWGAEVLEQRFIRPRPADGEGH